LGIYYFSFKIIEYRVLYIGKRGKVIMKLIVGLGNIGKEYENTRHNAGFEVIDILANKLNIKINQKKFKATIGTATINGEKVVLMKPSTYMNLSGNAVIECVRFFKIETGDIIIVHDDLDLPVGKIRIRQQGSAGGQKGIKSIMDQLHTNDLNRIRIGIDKDPRIPVVDYVLGKTRKVDIPLYTEALNKAAEALETSITMDFNKVMNRYN
jgi:PTH1 family peptidyl-tRNA hydrolase